MAAEPAATARPAADRSDTGAPEEKEAALGHWVLKDVISIGQCDRMSYTFMYVPKICQWI